MVMATFHDDPGLADLLERQKTDGLAVDGGVAGEANRTKGDDDYLVESFDGEPGLRLLSGSALKD